MADLKETAREKATCTGNFEGEIVPRPELSVRGRGNRQIELFLQACREGQALRLAMNGRRRENVVNGVRVAGARHGYRVHAQLDGPDYILVWGVKKDANE